MPVKPDVSLPIPPLLKKKKSNDKVSRWIEGVHVICLDVCSVLDPVPHEIWLEKLIQIGLGRSAAAWIENWLRDCKQRVTTNGGGAHREQWLSFPWEDRTQKTSLRESGFEFIWGRDMDHLQSNKDLMKALTAGSEEEERCTLINAKSHLTRRTSGSRSPPFLWVPFLNFQLL